YTCGSLLCVFITAPLVRKTIRSTTLLMFYTFISFIALLTVCLPKQDPAKNAEFARRRIERKRQRELEQQMEAVKRGELPESLRV
ncbi:hypothetical protein MJL27_26825, partial [Salmonella enterica subsp. enterica serovar Anatum]|nr:hypothetical protein [Salmonella enterica subsp. enterica serovar Anatum]